MSIFRLLARGRYFIVLIAVWLVSIPAAEAVFRGMGDRPSGDLAGLFTAFGNGGYKLAPSVDTTATWTAGRFTVHTDGLGLRSDGAGRLAVKAGDHIDALFIGDSQGFGHGVSFEESLTGGVAELALRDGVRFANASVGGHATGNQFELAQWLHDKEGVTVSHYILLATPTMVRGVGGYTRATVGSDGRLYEDSSSSAALARVWLKTHFVIYGRIRDALRTMGLGNGTADVPSALGVFRSETSDDAVDAKWVSFLDEFQDFARKQGADIRIIYTPLTVEADFDVIDENAREIGITVDRDLPFRIVSAAAAAAGIRLHDLRPVLTQLHSRGDLLHLKGDFHYNRNLSAASASYIWDNLKNDLTAYQGRSSKFDEHRMTDYGQYRNLSNRLDTSRFHPGQIQSSRP